MIGCILVVVECSSVMVVVVVGKSLEEEGVDGRSLEDKFQT
jgi:hypothetical protein